jgi:hypothetical protein
MKLKRFLFLGACALSIGLGVGVSMAQSVPDYRCRDCYSFFLQCLAICDSEGGVGCGRACARQRAECEAIFCN